MQNLYTTQQVVGGLILIVLFLILFIANVMKPEMKMLFIPILVSITISLLAYVIVLTELITTKKNLLTQRSTFSFKNCPDGYEKRLNFDGKIKEIQCFDSSQSIPSFFLQGNDDKCKTDLISANGCFNQINDREQKCENVRTFFNSDTTGDILNKWTEFQNQCSI